MGSNYGAGMFRNKDAGLGLGEEDASCPGCLLDKSQVIKTQAAGIQYFYTTGPSAHSYAPAPRTD